MRRLLRIGRGDEPRRGLRFVPTELRRHALRPDRERPGFTVDAIQTALQGVSEVQTVSLSGYDTNGDSYRLSYDGAESVPITRGQNNTTAGIAAALRAVTSSSR